MMKRRSNGLPENRKSNWGLVVMVVLAAGASIYAVADSCPEPVMPMATEMVQPVTHEQIQQIAAFDPFLSDQKDVSVARADVVPAKVETMEPAVVVQEEEILVASVNLPSPEPVSVLALESEDSSEVQIAQASPQDENLDAQDNSEPNGSQNGNGQGEKKNKLFGGKNGWVLPTALIAGGVTGITIGTVAIVKNNKHDKDDPPLTY